MIVDRVENRSRYFHGEAWRKVFGYLSALPKDAPDGTVELQGRRIYATVMGYETIPEELAVLEAHRRYVDIQATLVNSERIAWCPVNGLIPKDGYDAERDVTFFNIPDSMPTQAVVHPGIFVALFPEDAHMPKLIAGSSQRVRKVVVKFHVDLLKE